MKSIDLLRPPMGFVGLSRSLLTACFLFITLCTLAQRPQFQKWNAGLALGMSPLTAALPLPTLTGHMGRWSAEVSPYVFNHGLGITHHFPVLTVFKKLHFTIDAMAFFARQNANYYPTFPSIAYMQNRLSTGLMAGPSVYFLKRCAVQLLVGAQLLTEYGDPELMPGGSPSSYVFESGAIALHVRLFKNFVPQ